MKWIAVLLLAIALSIGIGAVSFLFAFVGYTLGVAGWVLAAMAGAWLLLRLLVREYHAETLPAPRRGHKREESK